MRLLRLIFFIIFLMSNNANANNKASLEQAKNNLNKIKNEQNQQLKIKTNLEKQIEKLNVLKESYFPKSEAVTSEITETDENIEVSGEQSTEKLDENMKQYTSALTRYHN